MQRNEDGGVVISCDFCGTDWDQVKPMIEGHHGSVICADCLRVAVDSAAVRPGRHVCTMCIRDDLPEDMEKWIPSPLPDRANPQASICVECIRQADGAFRRDPDVEWGGGD